MSAIVDPHVAEEPSPSSVLASQLISRSSSTAISGATSPPTSSRLRLLQEADQRLLLTSATMGSGSLSLPSEEEALPIEPSMQDVLVDAADSHWLSRMSTAERELEVSRRLWEVFDAVSCRLISGAAPERMSRAGRIAWRTLSSTEAVGVIQESPTGVDWMERLRSYREDRATCHRHWERNQTAQAPPRAEEAVRAVRAHPEGHH